MYDKIHYKLKKKKKEKRERQHDLCFPVLYGI